MPDVSPAKALDNYAFKTGDNDAVPWTTENPANLRVAIRIGAEGVGDEPLPDAGDEYIYDSDGITLDGSRSMDREDGAVLNNYLWRRLPEGDVLCDSASPLCEILPLGRAEEIVELQVRDNDLNTSAISVKIVHPGFEGAEGPEGPRGLQGIQGEQGETGDAGVQGPPGITPEEIQAMQQMINENRELLQALPQLRKKLEELQAQN